MWTDFNVNNSVRVKLTPEGRAELRRRHARLYADYGYIEYREPDEDSEGWSKWQLWDLMKQLGPKCIMGCPQPFSTQIQFEVRDSGSASESR